MVCVHMHVMVCVHMHACTEQEGFEVPSGADYNQLQQRVDVKTYNGPSFQMTGIFRPDKHA